MNPTRMSGLERGVPLLIAALGALLWMVHAEAWSLGRRSPVLGFDAAQYAVAARTLARTGQLATPFALPIELERRAAPPWPLAVVQPGLVVVEAVLLAAAPKEIGPFDLSTPATRERLMLLPPLLSFLALAALIPWMVLGLLATHAPGLPPRSRAALAAVAGLGFVCDPEAQHFAAGGLTELPFTLGLVLAFGLLARGTAARRPLLFGLLLGVTGAFRGSMLWLLPALALAAARSAAPGRRLGAALLVLAGFALPLAPWWLYKWRSFGNAGWDLSALGVWDGAAGRTWFSLTHLPRHPDLPGALPPAAELTAKLERNLAQLLPALLGGWRGVLAAALAAWTLVPGGARALRPTGAAILAALAISVCAAALGASWLRYLFPARIALEAAGLVALFALAARAPLSPPMWRGLAAGLATIAVAWGVSQTLSGNAEAARAAASRGLPGVATLADLGARIEREVPEGETVMSNLGPVLSWHARRPVLHLALTPDDVAACRARLPFRHVVLAFPDSSRAWPGWGGLIAHPGSAPSGWNVTAARHWESAEGVRIVWFTLGPERP